MQTAAQSRPAPADEQPTRLLLIRAKAGELPWLAETIRHFMAPADVVQVVGLGNALWRLGQERFDTILLDLAGIDARNLQRCREQIADLASVPILNLHDEPEQALERIRTQQRSEPPRRPEKPAARVAASHRVTRLPWQRRPKRQPEVASAG